MAERSSIRRRNALRLTILRTLQVGAILSLALVAFLILWGALIELGDRAGAQVTGGIAGGLAICWAATLVALVVLLALAYLAAGEMVAERAPAANDTAPPGGRP